MNRRLAVACAAAILCIASAPATQEYRNISLADYGRIVAGAIRFEPGEYAVVSRMASYDIKSLPNDSAEAKYVLGLMRQKLASGASMSGKLCLAGAVGAGINSPLDPSACKIESLRINGNVVDTTLTCKATSQHRDFRIAMRATYSSDHYSYRSNTMTVVSAGGQLHPAQMTAVGEAHRVGGCSAG